MVKYIYGKYKSVIAYGEWGPQKTGGGGYSFGDHLLTDTLSTGTTYAYKDDIGYYFTPSILKTVEEIKSIVDSGGTIFLVVSSSTSRNIVKLKSVTQNSYSKLYQFQSNTVVVRERAWERAKGDFVENVVAEDGAYPDNGYKDGDGYWYVKIGLENNVPTIELTTTTNITLYEKDTFILNGTAADTDNGNIVNVKYQINNGTIRPITTSISTGVAIPFNKTLTFKTGKLFDGEIAITDNLTEGVGHTLKVWAEDDQGGKSTEEIRTFYVVPNRPPALTVNTVTPNGTIDSDTFTISGSCSDLDGNSMIVSYKLNGGLKTQIYSGIDGEWSFDISLGQLIIGTNTIVIEAIDSYDFKTSKTIRLNKTSNSIPLLKSEARYKITPPKGKAKGILLWIQRDKGLSLSAEISMTLNGEQELFVPMTLSNTAPVNSDIVEDEYYYDSLEEKENIIVKLNLTRETLETNNSITLVSGVLE